jgi:hypothetical protein
VYESEVKLVDAVRSHPIVEDEMQRNSSFFGPGTDLTKLPFRQKNFSD